MNRAFRGYNPGGSVSCEKLKPMKNLIYIIIILSGLAVFIASGEERQKRDFRPIVPGQFTSASLIEKAKSWEGKHYRPGVSAQCAAWVGQVVQSAGGRLPQGHMMARSWLNWGYSVPRSSIRPGDLVVTWRGSPRSASGHILIYLGNGECIHRPTRSKPVQRIKLSTYSSKIIGVRRKK